MRKIIDRKIYDTETSEKIADYWNGVSTNDFNYISEDLYRTIKGAWFLNCEGGTNTVYDGKEIKPLLDYEAYEWLEMHGKTEVIEKYFKESIEEA